MEATQRRTEAASPVRVRLRADVFEALATSRGAKTTVARARLFGIHKATLIRIKEGHGEPSLVLAMRMARALGVEVETLFRLDDELESAA